jgi:hypothetical protein
VRVVVARGDAADDDAIAALVDLARAHDRRRDRGLDDRQVVVADGAIEIRGEDRDAGARGQPVLEHDVEVDVAELLIDRDVDPVPNFCLGSSAPAEVWSCRRP